MHTYRVCQKTPKIQLRNFRKFALPTSWGDKVAELVIWGFFRPKIPKYGLPNSTPIVAVVRNRGAKNNKVILIPAVFFQ